MIIYQIKLPKKQNAEAFVKFTLEEYFPAVHKGPTRVGKVTDLVLLQPESKGPGLRAMNSFGTSVGPVWRWAAIAWTMRVARKLESFKARIKRLGFYSEVAAWHEGDVA